MNLHLQLELDDYQLIQMGNILDGKKSKRKATKSEVIDLLTGAIDFFTFDEDDDLPEKIRPRKPGGKMKVSLQSLLVVDKEDAVLLRGKSANYITGWNRVKRR